MSVIHLGTVQHSHQCIAFIQQFPAAFEKLTGRVALDGFVRPDYGMPGRLQATFEFAKPVLFGFGEEGACEVDFGHGLIIFY